MAAYALASSSNFKKMKKTIMAADDQKERQKTINGPHIPDEVIDKIISFLPLKNAFRSGLMSKRFSDSWKLSRDLSFDIDYRTLGNNDCGDSREDMFKLVQFVMDEHRGPVISRLKLILDPSGKEGQVCEWIRKALSKGVEELDLDFSAGNLRFCFPSNILREEAARNLHALKVCYCDLPSVAQFVSFGYLKKLSLEDVYAPRYFVDAIFSYCLNLENFEICRGYQEPQLIIEAAKLRNFKSLKLENCNYLRNLYINAPSLEVFHYIGDICHLVFGEELAKIQQVILHFNQSRSICPFPGMDKVMMAIRRTKFLSVTSPFLERLCGSFCQNTYRDSNLFLGNLKEIRLLLGESTGTTTLCLQSTILNPYDIVCFLEKCPFLEKLSLDFGIFPLESGAYWEFVAKHEWESYFACFRLLRAVCFLNFKFLQLEMKLAEFILASAPMMENCVIVKARRYPGTREQEMQFALRSFPSKKFKAKIYDHNYPYESY